MEASGEPSCFVCSADADCRSRVERLIAPGWEVVPVDDPAHLRTTLRGARASRHGRAALVLDLTFAGGDEAPARHNAVTWQVASLMALALGATAVPTLVVTTFAPLSMVLAEQGVPIVAQVTPADSDVTWQHALTTLLSVRPLQAVPYPHHEDLPPRDESSALVTLREYPPLHWDRTAGTLIRDDQIIQLTPREHALLEILAQRPGHTFSARNLAQLLTTPEDTYGIAPHAVVQALSGLRRKLGDDTAQPPVIVNRRGFGYMLAQRPVQRIETLTHVTAGRHRRA